MSNLYDEFEQRFSDSWFSAGWVELENTKSEKKEVPHKDLATLQAELELINENIENIALKQLRLANLAKLYSI